MIPPLFALFAWIPVSVFFFWRYPLRVAILINFLGGWALLPSAAFVATPVLFPYWILGTCLPSNYFFTKATVTGMSGLLGILLFDRHSFERSQLSIWDLPMLAWCAVPIFSAVANEQSIGVSLRGGLYQSLAWGVPYLIGRLCFSDKASLQLAAKALVIAGLAYVPICLVEIFIGPQFYAHLYGYQPYRWIGAQRYFGFRPIGLLEDGNQLGIWMATSALIAIYLWKRNLIKDIIGIPIAWISAILLAVTILCQSAGSIILLIGLLLFLFSSRRDLAKTLTALVLLGVVTLIVLRLSNVISLRAIVKQSVAANTGAQFLKKLGRGSFGWRLSQDEKHVDDALEAPILGSGEWDWWKASSSRPWSLWLLTFGMYGIVGLYALEGLQFIPVARILWSPLARSETDGPDLRRALATVILMSALDNLLNGSMILPVLLLIGGLSTTGSSIFDVRMKRHQRTRGLPERHALSNQHKKTAP
jgi:uncharacterized membrane protein YGL010W